PRLRSLSPSMFFVDENLSAMKNEESTFSWSEWKRPVIAIILTVLSNVVSSMLAMGEWSYMSTVDHSSSASFYGYASSAYSAAHAVSAFVFAIWAHKISSTKVPLLASQCIILGASVMYIFVECIPHNRRWWILVCYVLFGVGFGTSPLLRSYIARVTSEENRSSAYALQNGANIVGPIAQIAFAHLPYPGIIVVPPYIKLHIYSAPVWFAFIINVVAIVITVLLLEDTEAITVIRKSEGKDTNHSSFSVGSIRDRLTSLRALDIPWLLVALVIFVAMATSLCDGAIGTVYGPMMSVMYGLRGEEIVMTMAIVQVACGLISSALSLLFFVCRLGKHVSCRVLFLFSNVIVIVGYVITFPFPITSNPMQPFNETTMTGCNPLEYPWCDTQLVVNLISCIIMITITTSLTTPAAMLSLDTIYSKVIGNIDQNVMQSVIVIADDIVQIVGPIYGSAIFTAFGINYIHYINGSIYLLATLVWIASWKWLLPYN
ncbi:hypothetical protein PENTCL1PPCAC_335, partial [Pristionchus entomophagus]